MAKVSDIQLRAQAVILAQEGYFYTIIVQKLECSKRWVGKWVSRCLKNPTLLINPDVAAPKFCQMLQRDLSEVLSINEDKACDEWLNN